MDEKTRTDVTRIREELDEYYEEMKKFRTMDLEEVLLDIAAWSARASEIRGQLVRFESTGKKALRINEIDPLLAELDRQFKIFSRIQTLRQDEWNKAKAWT